MKGFGASGTSQGSVRTTAKAWFELIDHGGRQHGRRAQAGVEDHLVSLAGFAHRHGPSGCAAGVAGGEMRGECRIAERNRVAVADGAVNRMFFAAGFHSFESGDVLGHRNHLCAGEFLDECIALHVITVGVVAEEDSGVGEFEAELLN